MTYFIQIVFLNIPLLFYVLKTIDNNIPRLIINKSILSV